MQNVKKFTMRNNKKLNMAYTYLIYLGLIDHLQVCVEKNKNYCYAFM